MKALTISPEFVELITNGIKTIECRTWKTDYRGDILITSSSKKRSGTIPSHALCIVELYDIRPMKKTDADAACMKQSECTSNNFAWLLRNVRLIEPFEVKGKLSLWNFDDESRIKVIMTVNELLSKPNEEYNAICDQYWEALYV